MSGRVHGNCLLPFLKLHVFDFFRLFAKVSKVSHSNILVANRSGHFNFSKSPLKKFYIVILALSVRNGFFFGA